MSAQPENIAEVSSVMDYLRDFYEKMKTVDQAIHSGMEDVRNRIAALSLAEDPEVQRRLRDIEDRRAAGKSFEHALTSSDLELH